MFDGEAVYRSRGYSDSGVVIADVLLDGHTYTEWLPEFASAKVYEYTISDESDVVFRRIGDRIDIVARLTSDSLPAAFSAGELATLLAEGELTLLRYEENDGRRQLVVEMRGHDPNSLPPTTWIDAITGARVGYRVQSGHGVLTVGCTITTPPDPFGAEVFVQDISPATSFAITQYVPFDSRTGVAIRDHFDMDTLLAANTDQHLRPIALLRVAEDMPSASDIGPGDDNYAIVYEGDAAMSSFKVIESTAIWMLPEQAYAVYISQNPHDDTCRAAERILADDTYVRASCDAASGHFVAVVGVSGDAMQLRRVSLRDTP